MAHLLFAHGDKGGVGKSLIAASVVDYCIAHDRPVGLIEGDKKNPDVGLRFKHLIDVEGVNLQRSDEREEAGIRLIRAANKLANHDNNENMIIVINLPASAGDTLGAIAEAIVDAADESGHTYSVVYCLGQLHPATDGIIQSAESGLIAAMDPKNVTIAYNHHLGDPKRWDYVRSGTRNEIGMNFNEVEIPELKSDDLANKVFSTRVPFSELVKRDCGELEVMERGIFRRNWLNEIHDMAGKLIPEPVGEDSSHG